MKDKKAPPTNAYEVLERVCELIPQHRLQYCQDYWVLRRGSETKGGMELPYQLNVPENECGTAFCRAGWAMIAVDGYEAVKNIERSYLVQDRVYELLGADESLGLDSFRLDVDRLFDGPAVDLALGGYYPGTDAYIAEGVRGVRNFMAKWEERLKATPVEAKK